MKKTVVARVSTDAGTPALTFSEVVENGFCVGCGACRVATRGAIQIDRDKFGIRQAVPIVDDALVDVAASVCPFSENSGSESEIAKASFAKYSYPTHSVLGHYGFTGAGRVLDDKDIVGSSSGGLTSWLLSRMLAENLIDGVLHVGRTDDSDSGIFEYKVSYSLAELKDRRKSQYYSCQFSDVILSVLGSGKRFAVVGVPCFITAARLLARADAEVSKVLSFFVGIVCGHLKSASFAELMAWQVGVPPEKLAVVDFRIKDEHRSSNKYLFGATDLDGYSPTPKVASELLGGNWGHALFQLKACDFCDDIFAETADIVFGDAWIPKYEKDWRGTNVVVCRNPVLQELIIGGHASGELLLDTLPVEDVVRSQAGNLRHRWDGLAVRSADDLAQGKKIPRKRILPGSRPTSFVRRLIVRLRRRISERSHPLFLEAKKRRSLVYFFEGMKFYLISMKILGRIEHSRFFRFLK